jgi:hypothetical protein
LPAPPRFLYLAWLQETLQAYAQAAARPAPGGRAQSLSPRQYGAALLMAYLGEFSLQELAAAVGVDPAALEEWRASPEFLQVMDWSKSRFAKSLQETLVLEDFSWQEYEELAGEFACLEESLRVRVRTVLYPQLRDLGERLASQYQHGLPLEMSHFPTFRRLLRFFWALEIFWPSAARSRLKEKCLPLAREVVWPALGLPQEPELSPQSWETGEFLNLKEILATEIRKVFKNVPGGDGF